MIFVLFLIIFFCACSHKGYEIIEEDGKHYLIIDNPEALATPEFPGYALELSPVVGFNSISEMREDILAGRFSQEELAQISKFSRDDQGRILLCNMSTLFEPSFPSIFDDYGVGWKGHTYYLFFNSKNFKHSTFLNFIDKTRYDKELSTIEILESNPSIKVISKSMDSSNGDVTFEYLTSQELHVKLIIYTVSSGDRILHVEETYYPDESTVIPQSTSILGYEYGQYYKISLSDLNIPPLTEEQLLQFGIHEYS